MKDADDWLVNAMAILFIIAGVAFLVVTILGVAGVIPV